ncbi:MAG: hypothetical protein R6W99_07400, partial [Clostridia bacterium]
MKHIEERRKKIAGYLAGESYTPMTLDELCVVLDVPCSDRDEFANLLGGMVRTGIIRISKNGRYTIPRDTSV